MAVCGEMKLMSELVNGQIERYRVIQRNGDNGAVGGHLDVFLLGRKTELLDFLIDVVLNVVRSFLGIGGGGKARFGGHGVLQLVIREKCRNELEGAVGRRGENDDGDEEAELGPASLVIANTHGAQN